MIVDQQLLQPLHVRCTFEEFGALSGGGVVAEFRPCYPVGRNRKRDKNVPYSQGIRDWIISSPLRSSHRFKSFPSFDLLSLVIGERIICSLRPRCYEFAVPVLPEGCYSSITAINRSHYTLRSRRKRTGFDTKYEKIFAP